MEKFFYLKYINLDGGESLFIGLAQDYETALKNFTSKNPDYSDSITLITSQLENLKLNKKVIVVENQKVDSFKSMGQLIFNEVKSEFNFDELYNSKRLTSKYYKRHLAALTLKYKGNYSGTFTYTYQLIQNEEKNLELRYLIKDFATFLILKVDATDLFYKFLLNFIESNTEQEERMRKSFSNGDPDYKRYSDYFDYEF